MLCSVDLGPNGELVEQVAWAPYCPILWLYENVPIVTDFYDWQAWQLDKLYD
jgi:hypothetical protein